MIVFDVMVKNFIKNGPCKFILTNFIQYNMTNRIVAMYYIWFHHSFTSLSLGKFNNKTISSRTFCQYGTVSYIYIYIYLISSKN